jgi:hypothetical protein
VKESSIRGTRHRADVLRVVTVVAVAIYLVPEGAHFFEMSNKLRMAPNDYMTAQSIYDGWALFGVAIVLAVGWTLGHAIAMRRNPLACRLSLASSALLVGTQVIFWSFIYPVNALTRNWTEMPDNFDAARRQWEYAHAASAGVTLLSLVLVLFAILVGVRVEPSAFDGRSIDAAGPTGHFPSPILAITAVLSTSAFLALAILGWGGLQPFFSHGPLKALTGVTAMLTMASMFTAGNLNSGVREDRSNRWVLAAFAMLGFLIGWVPALTDRMDWGDYRWRYNPVARCRALHDRRRDEALACVRAGQSL